MIGRADIEGSKKQRRYERLAATSQLSLWYAYPASAIANITELAHGRLRMQTPLDFGPYSEASVEAPISGGADYTLDHSPFGRMTHIHLVSGPSPPPFGSGAWLRIAHCNIQRPFYHPRSRRGHHPIGSNGLVALALGDPRNLDALPDTTAEKIQDRAD